MNTITTDLIQQLARFAELPLADPQVAKVQANLNSIVPLLEMLDQLDLDALEPVTTFSADWEDA